MKELGELIEQSEANLVKRILEFAKANGYVKYTSPLEEPWYVSIAGVSRVLLEALERGISLELNPDEDFTKDSVAGFAILMAGRHRVRGITLSMFLGLLKYYRQSYMDLIRENTLNREQELKYLNFINRCFDRMEIGVSIEWRSWSETDILIKMQGENRILTNEKNKYLTAFESMPTPVFLLDEAGGLDNVNYAGLELIHGLVVPRSLYYRYCNLENLIGTSLGMYFPWFDQELNVFRKSSRQEISFEKDVVLKDGRRRNYLVRLKRLINLNDKIPGIIVIFTDLTERKQVEERVRYYSIHDTLTDLFNRNYFEQEIYRLEREEVIPSGLIICDLDGLKLINDTMGHEAGDRLLKAAAGILRDCFRERDMVARIGGDEFAVLLPGADHKVVGESLQRIYRKIDEYNEQHPDFNVRMSVGYAIRDHVEKTLGSVFKEADNNMYREKLYSSSSSRSAIVQTLMKALEARDLITESHSARLQCLVEHLCTRMGMPEQEVTTMKLLAQFHDIGKVGISDKILFKTGVYTEEEFGEMKRHCEIGYRIALASPQLAPIADWILKHHEWWNGKGYPLGLQEEQIPLQCRILAIANAFDAMTTNRPYRKALGKEEAIKELVRFAGLQFDPVLVPRFIEMVKDRSVVQEDGSCAPLGQH